MQLTKMLALVAILSLVSFADRLYGDVYEWENLSKVDGAVLRLYDPQGLLLKQEVIFSSYSLDVSAGAYRIEVNWLNRNSGEQLTAEENISVSGDTRVDLLLLPSLEEIFGGELAGPAPLETGFQGAVPEEKPKLDIIPYLLGGAFLLSVILVLMWLYRSRGRASKKELDYDDKARLLELIRQEGTISQTELIEKTNFSKAKASMLLSELEREKRIRRRKIGRKKLVSPAVP